MKPQTVAHWNDKPSAGNARGRIAGGDALTRNFVDASIVVDRVLREYRKNGGFLRIENLLRKHRGLPWYLRKSPDEATGSK